MRQQAACMCVAAGSGGRGHDPDGRQAAIVHAAVGRGCGVRAKACNGSVVHATVCSGGSVCAAVGGGGQQHDCNGRQ